MLGIIKKLFKKEQKDESVMDAKTVELVQTSFAKVKPIAATAAEIFYAKLFEADPEVKKLFPPKEEDMKVQGNKLMTMLGAAVVGLNDIEKLVPVLQDLAVRHVPYGVKEEHYPTVGAALLDTLEAGLGDDFTPDVKKAWADVYGVIADVMIKAAY